ncbi:MAG TPA: CidA/LrgA family protein [Anaeromyxobacteraceae bacterium]|nr:CidA/LrgA family protein [Anaeromyxobacteraceae bacterium]
MPNVVRVPLQIAVLTLFWAAGGRLSAWLGLPIPGAVIGMVLLLAALRLRLVRPEWLDAGSDFLLRHMLLFFIPAAVGVVQFPELLGVAGARVLAIVAASTLLVMIATGGAVEWAVRRRGLDA